MKRGRRLLTIACLIISILAVTPLTSAVASEIPKVTPKATEKIRITIGTETVEKEVPLDTIKDIIDLGKTCKEDFLTIFNKQLSEDEVAQAFENIKPFFQALADNDLTEKSVDELSEMFHQIRNKIRQPRPRTVGLWNGIPTPIFGNAGAGLFNVGESALGFTLGTHTLFPTIGADILTTWTDIGETATIGGFGFTTATGPEFGLILGFIGIMICLPIMIIGFIFQVGFVGAYFGLNILPFAR